MAQSWGIEFGKEIRAKSDKKFGKLSPPETARLFFRHLLDNVGQFQSLYDGLFRWKMNDDLSLPSFNAVRPYFTHLMMTAEANSTAGAAILNAATKTAQPRFEDAVESEDEEIGKLDDDKFADDQETPFETASECAYDDDDDFDDNIYDSIYGMYLNESRRMTSDHENASDSTTDIELFDDLQPICRLEDKPRERRPFNINQAQLETDFDFESNLSVFRKIPLPSDVAAAARENTKNREEAIQQLLQRAAPKKRYRPIDREWK